jgi:hypothetical protein
MAVGELQGFGGELTEVGLQGQPLKLPRQVAGSVGPVKAPLHPLRSQL